MSLRQWMELSLSGDQVTVELLPDDPPFLQSIDLVASFWKKNYENPVPYDQEELISRLLKAYSGLVFAPGGNLTVDYMGDKLRLGVVSLGIAELTKEQMGGRSNSSRHIEMGVMMTTTDITIMKDGGSRMRIKDSAKK
jgi:vesicle-fusing ATPase